MAPPRPGRVESRDLPGLRVQLRREGGEGCANPVLGSAPPAWEVQLKRDPRYRLYPGPHCALP